MIEDLELRELFQTEADEHLQTLDDGLLRLETAPGDSATLEGVFRAAHSLKGAARMLGVGRVELLAHHMEEELGGVRRGQARLSSDAIDRYSVGLAAMREFVLEAVTGAASSLDVERVLSQLSGQTPLSDAASNISAPEAAASEVSVPEVAASDAGAIDASVSARQTASASPFSSQIAAYAPLASTLSAPLVPGESADLAPPAHPPLAMPPSSLPELREAPPETLAIPAATPPILAVADAPRETLAVSDAVSHLVAVSDSPTESLAVPDVVPDVVSDAPREELAVPNPPRETLAVPETASNLTPSGGAAPTLAPVATPIEEAPREDFRIQTLRVPPAKLDALMNLASELTVTGTRVGRGLTTFAEIGALWEEWQRDGAGQRSAWSRVQNGQGTGADWKQLAAAQSRNETRLARLGALWERLQSTNYEDVTRLNFVAGELETGIRGVRLLPLSQVFGLFPRLVRDLARELGKEVDFQIYGGDIAADKRILEEIKDPLMHMLRNGLDHGLETPEVRAKAGKPRVARLQLRASQTANSVLIELQDDGRGLDIAAIKRTALARRLHTQSELEAMTTSQLHGLIFAPGFSTSTLVTDVSGRGVGMDVVATNIERLKGSIAVASQPGIGTTFTLRLPSTLATTRVLLVGVGGRTFALPVEWVQTILSAPREQIFSLEGRAHLLFDGRAIPVSRLGALLELPAPAPASALETPITIVLEVGETRIGVQVESLIDEQEVLLKPLGAMLKRVRNVSGLTILGAGEICMVLSAPDLAKSALKHGASLPVPALPAAPAPRKTLLLAEDSITTRTQEKRILEGAGYEVVTAVDGLDAWRKLETRSFDGVVSDIEMPNLDGLALAERIRALPQYNEMPIILVTSLSSDADKARGAQVGANAYITKGAFEQNVLLDTLRRLV